MDPLTTLPPEWWTQFDGQALETKLGVSAILATADADGWPRLSYLSVGEILATPPASLSILLWPAARTAANLTRDGRAVLHAAANGVVWSVRASLRRRASAEAALAIFDGELTHAEPHSAPYADVQTLTAFNLHAPDETLARWRAQARMLARRDG